MRFNPIKSLEADDIFISYSRRDASAYVSGLDAGLSARGFACFTDKRGTDAARLPPPTLFRKIRRCKTLVLLGTAGALGNPENIAPEVSEFSDANGTDRIICVDFDQDGQFSDWSKTPWYTYVEGKSHEQELASSLKTGTPSDHVVEAIVLASDYMKSKDRLRKYRNQAIGVLGILVIIIIIAAITSVVMTMRAAAATKQASAATKNAEKALADAKAAQAEANTAQQAAEAAKTDAANQKRLADDATERAAAQTALANAASQKAQVAEARATAEQTRAEKQGAIADSRSLANQSADFRNRTANDIQRSLSLAVQAVKRSPTIEANTALRESLALLPALRSSNKYAGHNDQISGALSPNGQYFATVSADHKLRIYEAAKFETSRQPLMQLDCECAAAVMSDGLAFAAAATEQGVKIFDLKQPSKSHAIKDLVASQIAISPGGKYLAISIDDGEDVGRFSDVAIIDAATGRPIKTFKDLNVLINAVAFGPSGNLAAAGRSTAPEGGQLRGKVLLWPLAEEGSGNEEPALTETSVTDPVVISQPSTVDAIAPGPDATSFATETGVWKKSSGRTSYELFARLPYVQYYTKSFISKIAFSSSGDSIAVLRNIEAVQQNANDSDESDLELWNANGQRNLAEKFQDKEITRLSFKPGGELIAAIGGQPDRENPGVLLKSIGGQAVGSIMFESDPSEKPIKDPLPNNFFVTTADNKVLVRNIWQSGKRELAFGDSLTKVDNITSSENGKFLALSGADHNRSNAIVVYRAEGETYVRYKLIPQAKREFEDIVRMSLSNDGQTVAVLYTYNEEFLRIWDVANARDVSPPALEKVLDVTQMMLSPLGQFLVTTNRDNETFIMDLSRGKKTKPVLLLDSTKLTLMSFSQDDRYLGCGSDENLVHVFDTKGANGIAEIARLSHTGNITAIAFSEKGKYVATASSDPHAYKIEVEESYPVRVWLLQPGDLVNEASARLQGLGQTGKRK